MRRTVAAGLLLLAACGGGGDEPGTSTTAPDGTTTTVAAATTTTAEAATTTTAAPPDATTTSVPLDDPGEGEGIGDLELIVHDLLVTAGELGPGFEDQGFAADAVGPCQPGGAPDVAVGTTAADPAAGVTVIEELRVYPSAGDAAAAYAAVSCGATDATERIGGDAASTATAGGAFVAVAVVSDVVLTVVVTGQGPSDPLDVAAFAVGKVLAALGR